MNKLACVSLLFISAALQAAPPAPQVRVRAAQKQLIFDWPQMTEAQRYELWYRSTTNAAWRKLQDRPFNATSAAIAVSVHLLNWREVRFRIDACDFSECTPSAEISVDQLMRYPVAYFKPESPGERQEFGSVVALSADGRAMAVWSGTLISDITPLVSLYRRIGAEWVPDGIAVPQPAVRNSLGPSPHHTLALNGDGTVLAVGRPEERSTWPGNSTYGATHVFRRLNGNWQFEQKLVPEDGSQYRFVGHVVEMDDAGERIAVMVMDRTTMHAGEVHLYRTVGGTWVLEKIFPVPPHVSGTYANCGAIALSGDGNRLTRQCGRNDPTYQSYVETFTAPGWNAGPELVLANDLTPRPAIDLNGDGTLLAASVGSAVTAMWRLTGAGWQPDGPYGAAALIPVSELNMTISRNGNYVAFGNAGDSTLGLGVVYPPFSRGLDTGTVRIFERRGGAWPLLRTLKSNSTTQQRFGFSLALGDNGSVLAVGAPADSSGATGIDGEQHDTTSRASGAVWLY